MSEIESTQLSIPSRKEQTHILLNKTLAFLRRKWNFYAYHLLIIPLSFFWIAYVNYLIATKSVLMEEKSFAPEKLGAFERCASSNCLQLGVVLISKEPNAEVRPWINEAVAHLKAKLGLNGENDLKILYNGKDANEIQAEMEKYSEVANMLYFCNDYHMFDNDLLRMNCDRVESPALGNFNITMYSVAYNQTRLAPNFLKNYNIPLGIDRNSVLLKKTMDEFVINRSRNNPTEDWREKLPSLSAGFEPADASYYIIDEGVANSNNERQGPRTAKADSNGAFEYDINTMSYVQPKFSLLSRFDSSVTYGSFFFVFVILLSFSQFMKIMAQEKDQKLRRGLIPYGLSASAYYCSWTLYALGFNFLMSLLMWLMGYCMNYAMFKGVPIPLVILVFFLTLMAYSFLAMVIVACTDDFKSANKITYTFIVVSIFLEMFFSNRGVITLFYMSTAPALIKVLRVLFCLIPSFPFSLIISNMSVATGYSFDPMNFALVLGPGYGYGKFFEETLRESKLTGDMVIPADAVTTLWLVANCLLFIALLYIADNKVESNNGFRRTLYGKEEKPLPPPEANSIDSLSERMIEKPVFERRNTNSVSLIDLRNIVKIYKLDLLGNKRNFALRDFSLTIRENEVLALLGENGAGKSTLISIIAGNLKADSGEVFYRGRLFGQDPNDKLLVSVCPQYDLLWTELSVFENMQLIGRFRGLTDVQIETQVADILAKMGLADQRENIVRNLSGGMRRRISVGISLIGDPDLVILDEPTTGLDPVHRKSVWNFVKDLKASGKTVLLTTHIMDEADYLADRIAIINKGELLADNTAVGIKAEFQSFNAIFSVKEYSEAHFLKLQELFEKFYGSKFALKYKSNSLIKFNMPAEDMHITVDLVRVLENVHNDPQYAWLAEFVDSFEVASLDLEEAYMLINEKHKARDPAN